VIVGDEKTPPAYHYLEVVFLDVTTQKELPLSVRRTWERDGIVNNTLRWLS
jgi:hypothetical protein